jgi:hypothetical protein
MQNPPTSFATGETAEGDVVLMLERDGEWKVLTHVSPQRAMDIGHDLRQVGEHLATEEEE